MPLSVAKARSAYSRCIVEQNAGTKFWSCSSSLSVGEIPQTIIFVAALNATLDTVSGRIVLLVVDATTSFPFADLPCFLPRLFSGTVGGSFAVPNTTLLTTAPHQTRPISFLLMSAESSSSLTSALTLSNRTKNADTRAITDGSDSVPGRGSTIDQMSSKPSRHRARSRSRSDCAEVEPEVVSGKDEAKVDRCESMRAWIWGGRLREGKTGVEEVELEAERLGVRAEEKRLCSWRSVSLVDLHEGKVGG
jgi:hypothetical protein